MLPLALLHAAQAKPMLVELKNGETFNGHLVGCDNFMNLTLKEVYQTSADGERFWKLAEAYVRGNNIKYIRVAENVRPSPVPSPSAAPAAPSSPTARPVPSPRADLSLPRTHPRRCSSSTKSRSKKKSNGDEASGEAACAAAAAAAAQARAHGAATAEEDEDAARIVGADEADQHGAARGAGAAAAAAAACRKDGNGMHLFVRRGFAPARQDNSLCAVPPEHPATRDLPRASVL
ncbi:hypothetical protein JCM1841_004696 [Sporobolomyces salmonicolor]